MKIDRTIKVGVLSSLIAAVFFLYLIDPILTSLARVFFRVASLFGASYADRFFAGIAAGPEDYAFMLLAIGLGTVTGTLGLIPVLLIRDASTISKIDRQVVVASVDPIDQHATEDHREHWRRKLRQTIKFTRVTMPIASFLLVLSVMFLFGDGYARLRIRSTFEQQMIILGPVLTSDQLLRLRADFASMRGKADFDRLQANIDALAAKHGVGFPPNKLYPWF